MREMHRLQLDKTYLIHSGDYFGSSQNLFELPNIKIANTDAPIRQGMISYV